MKKYVQLIRLKHWIKNLLIFIPIICAGIFDINVITNTILGFFSFSCACSFIYIINDIKDVEKDKKNPRKKKRPLASGKIKKTTAIYVAILMIVLSIIINILASDSILSIYIILIYVIINILYSYGLKNLAIVDVILLATGFVLRVYYGATIASINVSNWLFLTILNGALFLGLGKRKKEFINNFESRKVLKEYNAEFLDKMQYLCLSLMLVFYSLWCIEQKTKLLIYTIPLIMIIFMRYCLIVEKSDEGDPTTILYSDKSLLILGIIYGIIMILNMVL